jgi:hypothetical protein
MTKAKFKMLCAVIFFISFFDKGTAGCCGNKADVQALITDVRN